MAIVIQIILGTIVATAVVAVAFGVFWTRRLGPALAEALPLMHELVTAFENAPDSYTLLREVNAQFHTDSGSSLRDSIDALVLSAVEVNNVVGMMKRSALRSATLAEEDRKTLHEITMMLDRLSIQAIASREADDRMEAATAVVATDLSVAQTKIEGVAKDLVHDRAAQAGIAQDQAAAHARADDTPTDAAPGHAADAAAKSPVTVDEPANET